MLRKFPGPAYMGLTRGWGRMGRLHAGQGFSPAHKVSRIAEAGIVV